MSMALIPFVVSLSNQGLNRFIQRFLRIEPVEAPCGVPFDRLSPNGM